MTVNPVSNVNSVSGSQQLQNHGKPNQKPKPSENPTDTVHLSPAALAHLKGADADGDGDGH